MVVNIRRWGMRQSIEGSEQVKVKSTVTAEE